MSVPFLFFKLGPSIRIRSKMAKHPAAVVEVKKDVENGEKADVGEEDRRSSEDTSKGVYSS